MYDLYAVSNHYGGLGGGHYTAYCQVEGEGWCNFDDAQASPMQPGKLETTDARTSAYVLFYRRQAETSASRCPASECAVAGLPAADWSVVPLLTAQDAAAPAHWAGQSERLVSSPTAASRQGRC